MALTDMTDDTIRAMVEYAKDREAQIASLAETTGRSADEIRAIADGEPPEEEPAEPEAAEPEAKETPKLADVRAADPPEEAKPEPPKRKNPKDWSAYDWTQLDPIIRAGLADGKAVYDIATGLGMPDSTLYHHVKKYPERFPEIKKPAKPSWPMPAGKSKPKQEPKQEPPKEDPPEIRAEPEPEPMTGNDERGQFLDQLGAVLSVVDWQAINVCIVTEDCRIEIMKSRRDT